MELAPGDTTLKVNPCSPNRSKYLYLIAGVWAGIVGAGLRVIIRLELGQPGSLIGIKYYNKVCSTFLAGWISMESITYDKNILEIL